MAVTLSSTLRARWASAKHVGDARPTQRVRVQRGYWQRGDAAHADNPFGWDWTQWWVPKGPWVEVPGVRRVDIQQSLDSNGCATATIELANFAMVEQAGLGGTYHLRKPGWLSPTRAYTGPSDESPEPVDAAANEWAMVFYESVRIRVDQGYGDEQLPQFDGLLDTGDGRSRDTSITLVARDHTNIPLDGHVFGWNTDPEKVETFVSEAWVEARETSDNPEVKAVGDKAREKWIVCEDLSTGVRKVMEWCGLAKGGIRLTGIHNWKEPQKFSRGEYLMDIIKAAQAACGFVWFMGQPREEDSTYELGRPTFRRSKSYVVPASTFTVADVDLVTDLQWTHTYEMLAAIIRVRGKEAPPVDGGVTLGADRTTRVMGVYRPPWHTEERDARKIRHAIHTEPKLKTIEEVTLMAMLIALNEALEANTARVEIPAYPGLELDDIFTVRDTITGISSRCWVAAKQQTFTAGEETTFTQSLSVALLDSPDVAEVIADIAAFLDSIPVVIDTDAQPTSRPT